MATLASRICPAATPVSRAMWTGRILSGLVVTFLLLDGAMKLLAVPVVSETMASLGWSCQAWPDA